MPSKHYLSLTCRSSQSDAVWWAVNCFCCTAFSRVHKWGTNLCSSTVLLSLRYSLWRLWKSEVSFSRAVPHCSWVHCAMWITTNLSSSFHIFQTKCGVQPSCYWLPACLWAWPDPTFMHCPARWSTTSIRSTLPGLWVFFLLLTLVSVDIGCSVLLKLPPSLQAGHNFHDVDYSYVQKLCGTMLKGPKLPVMWVLHILLRFSPISPSYMQCSQLN